MRFEEFRLSDVANGQMPGFWIIASSAWSISFVDSVFERATGSCARGSPPAQQRAPTDTDAAAMAFNPAAGFGMHPGAHVAGELDDPHRTTKGVGLNQLLIRLKRLHHPAW